MSHDSDVRKLLTIVQKAEQEKRDMTSHDAVNHPISCGYLLEFCQKSYCAENLNFVMAIDKYRDDCSLLDLKEPAGIRSCKEMADKIWADFLSCNSPNEVSVPYADREETERRMKSPESYGPKLFDVAIQDAMKTLQKDIVTRFVKAPQYTEMLNKLKSVVEDTTTNASNQYEIELPMKSFLTEERINGSKEFSLEEILNDRVLYLEMSNYLSKLFKTENLKCARQVRRFEELAKEKKLEELKEFAWGIYLNFIAPGSPFEISCTNLERKRVQLRLGCPTKEMFDGIKESTITVLKQDHKSFCATIQPKALKDRLKEDQSGGGGKKSFLSMLKIF